jgi:DUF971 family protein
MRKSGRPEPGYFVMTKNNPIPTEIKLLQKKRLLELTFDDGKHFALPCEYLRVHSPSAEVRGHGTGSAVLQTGKESVNIIGIDPVGQYAVKLIFDDGHSTGLYSWETLYDLGVNCEKYWQEYLAKVAMIPNA